MRAAGVGDLFLASTIFAIYAWGRHNTAFDSEKVASAMQQTVVLSDAIFLLLAAGFLFLGGILVAMVKPLYETSEEPQTQEHIPASQDWEKIKRSPKWETK